MDINLTSNPNNLHPVCCRCDRFPLVIARQMAWQSSKGRADELLRQLPELLLLIGPGRLLCELLEPNLAVGEVRCRRAGGEKVGRGRKGGDDVPVEAERVSPPMRCLERVEARLTDVAAPWDCDLNS